VGFLLAFQGVMDLATAAAGQGPARPLVLIDGIIKAIQGVMLCGIFPVI
jgi:hypothetical protein